MARKAGDWDAEQHPPHPLRGETGCEPQGHGPLACPSDTSKRHRHHGKKQHQLPLGNHAHVSTLMSSDDGENTRPYKQEGPSQTAHSYL